MRKHNPQTIEELLQRTREITLRITGKFIQGWYKKASFRTGPDEVPLADPNESVSDRCSLPANATFQRREAIVCVDELGKVRREKKVRHKTWSTYDPDAEDLQNVSKVKRTGVKRKNRLMARKKGGLV